MSPLCSVCAVQPLELVSPYALQRGTDHTGSCCRQSQVLHKFGQPPTMVTRSRTGSGPEEATAQRLAEELQKESSPSSTLRSLEELFLGLAIEPTGKQMALTFLRAGGLSTLIHHLGGGAAAAPLADSNMMPSDISEEAAKALNELLHTYDTTMAELRATTSFITPLVSALRAAPSMLARCVAADALAQIAAAQPAQGKAMAETGVMGLVLALYAAIWELPDAPEMAKPAAALSCALLCSEKHAARELEQAIRSPDAVQAFTALILFQVWHSSLKPWLRTLPAHMSNMSVFHIMSSQSWQQHRGRLRPTGWCRTLWSDGVCTDAMPRLYNPARTILTAVLPARSL
jgi:hypothetical protein